MNDADPPDGQPKTRLLSTREGIFAAGFEAGAKLAPLTAEQVQFAARLFAPTLNAATTGRIEACRG